MDLNALDNGKVKINLCGEELEVNKTDKVAFTLKELLEARSINSFTILLDGDEVESTNDLPDTFDGSAIEVRRAVKAGL